MDGNQNRPSNFKTGTVVGIFTKITFFPARNLVFIKKSTTVPWSVLEIKRFKRKRKLHAIRRFFFKRKGTTFKLLDPGFWQGFTLKDTLNSKQLISRFVQFF